MQYGNARGRNGLCVLGQLFGDVPAVIAILKGFWQQAEIIPITGCSYRLRNASPSTFTTDAEKKKISYSIVKKQSKWLFPCES